MNKIPNKLIKTLFLARFGSIFPIFEVKKIFLENLALSHATSYGFLAPCQNLEKVNDTIQRKCPDRWKDGRTDGDGRMDRPFFIGPFRVPPGVQKESKSISNLLTRTTNNNDLLT